MIDIYEQARNQYKSFYDKMVGSTKRIKALSEFTQEFQKIFQDFSKRIEASAGKFSTEFLQEPAENERLMHSMQFLNNTMLKLSNSYQKIALKIKNEVVDPYAMFMDNYRETNRGIAKKMTTMLEELDRLRQQTHKSQEAYYQSWAKYEKSKIDVEKAIEKIQKGGKNSDLIKANDHSVRLKMTTETCEKDYREDISKTNAQWKTVVSEFQNLCVLFEYNEESKLAFSRNTFNTSIRVLSDCNQVIQPELETKLKESEQLVKSVTAKLPLLQTLGSGSFKQFLSTDKKQSFVSYEDFKRKKDPKNNTEKPDPYKQLFKMISEPEKQETNKLIQGLIAQGKSDQQCQKIRSLITSSSTYSFYFIEQIYTRIFGMSLYYCKLDEECFKETGDIFRLIFKSLQNSYHSQKTVEFLYKLLVASGRIMKKKREKSGQPRELLSNWLGRVETKLFQNEKLWVALCNYIKHRPSSNTKKDASSEETANPASTVSKGVAFFAKGFSALVGKKEEPQKEEKDTFQSIQQVSNLMSSLALSTEHSLPIIKRLLEGHGGKQAYDFLKQNMHNKQDVHLREKLLSSKQIRRKREAELLEVIKYGGVGWYTLSLAAKLGYFTEEDGYILRQTCTKLKDTLKIILFKLPDHVVRAKLCKILQVHSKVSYEQLVEEANKGIVLGSVEEIISLDVNRSLHMHSEYLKPETLLRILRTFAYYHNNINYCQGMNYLAGYLFIRVRQESQAYLLFEKLMVDRFSSLFANEFQLLKIKMYQFERLLSIFLPEVADHFKRQLISAQCYIVSWIITLFSSTFQYTLKSHLVDVLWDRFLLWGWREFFRFTLWVFSLYKEELVDLTFDKALNFLGELTKKPLFVSDYYTLKTSGIIDADTLHDQISHFQISDALLDTLAKEYEISLEHPNKS